MSCSEYKNFQDFIEKNGMSRSEGIEYLKNELRKLGVPV